MSFVQNPYTILIEAAQADLTANTEGVITEGEIRSRLDSIEEVSEAVHISAEMVPVIAIGEDCLVEMTAVAGFMKSAGVKTVEEALDLIAEANSLEEKSVGLLVEADDYVEAMLEKASKMKSKESKNKVLDKIKKSTDLTDKLKKKGYKVKKKKPDKAVDEKCGGSKKPMDEKCGGSKKAMDEKCGGKPVDEKCKK